MRGLNTGFNRTPQRGSSLIIGLQICTGPGITARDPITIIIEGSNQPTLLFHIDSSWILIYSGLATDPGRLAYMVYLNSFLIIQFCIQALTCS